MAGERNRLTYIWHSYLKNPCNQNKALNDGKKVKLHFSHLLVNSPALQAPMTAN